MAGYLSQNPAKSNIVSEVEKYISRNATNDALKNVTFAVTECLAATCRKARHSKVCRPQCARVNLILNGTTPNLQGVSQCLDSLCTGGCDSLPFADQDVVGIGVGTVIQTLFKAACSPTIRSLRHILCNVFLLYCYGLGSRGLSL